MTGERESLKELGVSITQLEVDQRKAALKSQDNYKGLNDKQWETVATLELIKEKSGDAWASFEEGGGTADEVMDTLNKTLADLKTDAIEGFGGILVDIIDDLGILNGSFGDLGDWIDSNGKELRTLFIDLGIFISDSAESAFDLADAIATGLIDTAPMVSNWVRMLGQASSAAQMMAGAVLLMVPGMRDTGKALIDSAGNTGEPVARRDRAAGAGAAPPAALGDPCMTGAAEELYCLLVPLADDRLLVPRSCVTEVINYQAPTPMKARRRGT